MKNKKYKMIAADMDGTLLNDESVLTPRTKAAIIKVVESGLLFVAASGRSMRGLEMVNELFEKDMPFISFNGATVLMGKSRKVLSSKYLSFNLANEVYDIGMSREIPMILWSDSHLWASRDCKITRKYREGYGVDMKIISNMADLKDEGIFKMFWIDSKENIQHFQIEMKAHFGEKVNCHSSRPIFLEFVSPEASKGDAMVEVGKKFGIDRSEMIAVGDGYNDISMLSYAGLGVAMGNAPDDVKAVCGHVTLSNNADGAAVVMEEYLL